MPHWPWLILVIAYGACVGSFLNVLIYRLPAGKSLIKPGSHCPHCGHKLVWWENVPVLAWCYLRGKCRKCGRGISIQYPLIEAITAGLFALVYVMYYHAGLRPEWQDATLAGSWPVLVVHLGLVAALIGATMIDARHFIIPLSIPWTISIIAMIALPIAAMRMPTLLDLPPVWQMPGGDIFMLALGPGGVKLALGSGLGLLVALALLHARLIPRSMDDDPSLAEPPSHAAGEDRPEPDDEARHEADAAPDADGQLPWAELEHPRREVLKECLFIAWPVIGALLAYALAPDAWVDAAWLTQLGAVLLGGMAGAGIIWLVRILGTLAFGREAMGLGDVHLMFAVGACLGWADAIVVFFLAPFLGLAYTGLSLGVSKLIKREVAHIPYGPHLAAASAVIMCIGGIRLLVMLGIV